MTNIPRNSTTCCYMIQFPGYTQGVISLVFYSAGLYITYSFSSYETVTWASTLTWPGITGAPASSKATADILAEPPEL